MGPIILAALIAHQHQLFHVINFTDYHWIVQTNIRYSDSSNVY